MSDRHELIVLLQNHKKRTTSNKLLIFDRLSNHSAVTIKELYQDLAQDIDYTTFYRVLKEFRDLKIIQDTVIQGVRKIELTDKFGSHHHHLICVKCGEVVNIHDSKLEQYLALLAKRRGYEPRNHSFEIQGFCPACSPANQNVAEEYAKL